VVPLAGGGLGGHAAREVGLVNVVDGHVGVVRLAPALRVLVVEPLVVRRDEVAPLQDPQRALELLAPELRGAGHGALRAEAAVDEDDCAGGCAAEDFPPRDLVLRSRDVDPGSVVTHVPTSSIVATDAKVPDLPPQRNAPPVKPAMNRLRKTL